jgi:hypothetical protein
MRKPPPVRTGRGFVNAFSLFPLRREHAYTYHYYGLYYDIELSVGEKVHIIPDVTEGRK